MEEPVRFSDEIYELLKMSWRMEEWMRANPGMTREEAASDIMEIATREMPVETMRLVKDEPAKITMALELTYAGPLTDDVAVVDAARFLELDGWETLLLGYVLGCISRNQVPAMKYARKAYWIIMTGKTKGMCDEDLMVGVQFSKTILKYIARMPWLRRVFGIDGDVLMADRIKPGAKYADFRDLGKSHGTYSHKWFKAAQYILKHRDRYMRILSYQFLSAIVNGHNRVGGVRVQLNDEEYHALNNLLDGGFFYPSYENDDVFYGKLKDNGITGKNICHIAERIVAEKDKWKTHRFSLFCGALSRNEWVRSDGDFDCVADALFRARKLVRGGGQGMSEEGLMTIFEALDLEGFFTSLSDYALAMKELRVRPVMELSIRPRIMKKFAPKERFELYMLMLKRGLMKVKSASWMNALDFLVCTYETSVETMIEINGYAVSDSNARQFVIASGLNPEWIGSAGGRPEWRPAKSVTLVQNENPLPIFIDRGMLVKPHVRISISKTNYTIMRSWIEKPASGRTWELVMKLHSNGNVGAAAAVDADASASTDADADADADTDGLSPFIAEMLSRHPNVILSGSTPVRIATKLPRTSDCDFYAQPVHAVNLIDELQNYGYRCTAPSNMYGNGIQLFRMTLAHSDCSFGSSELRVVSYNQPAKPDGTVTMSYNKTNAETASPPLYYESFTFSITPNNRRNCANLERHFTEAQSSQIAYIRAYETSDEISMNSLDIYRMRSKRMPLCASMKPLMPHMPMEIDVIVCPADVMPRDFVAREFDLSVCKTYAQHVDDQIEIRSLYPDHISQKKVAFSFDQNMSFNLQKRRTMMMRFAKYCQNFEPIEGSVLQIREKHYRPMRGIDLETRHDYTNPHGHGHCLLQRIVKSNVGVNHWGVVVMAVEMVKNMIDFVENSRPIRENSLFGVLLGKIDRENDRPLKKSAFNGETPPPVGADQGCDMLLNFLSDAHPNKELRCRAILFTIGISRISGVLKYPTRDQLNEIAKAWTKRVGRRYGRIIVKIPFFWAILAGSDFFNVACENYANSLCPTERGDLRQIILDALREIQTTVDDGPSDHDAPDDGRKDYRKDDWKSPEPRDGDGDLRESAGAAPPILQKRRRPPPGRERAGPEAVQVPTEYRLPPAAENSDWVPEPPLRSAPQSATDPPVYRSPLGGEVIGDVRRRDGVYICTQALPWITTIEGDLQLRFCDCHFHQYNFITGLDGYANHVNMVNGHLPRCFYHRLQTDWRSLVTDSRYARMMTNDPPIWGEWLAENEGSLLLNDTLMPSDEAQEYRVSMSRLVNDWLYDRNRQMFQHPIMEERVGQVVLRMTRAPYDMLLDRTEGAAVEWAHTVPIEIVIHAYETVFEDPEISECERQARATKYHDVRDVRALAHTYRMSILGIVYGFEGFGTIHASHARLNGHPRFGYGTAGIWAYNTPEDWSSIATWIRVFSRRDARNRNETGGATLSRIIARVRARAEEAAVPDREAAAEAEAEAETNYSRRRESSDIFGSDSEPQNQRRSSAMSVAPPAVPRPAQPEAEPTDPIRYESWSHEPQEWPIPVADPPANRSRRRSFTTEELARSRENRSRQSSVASEDSGWVRRPSATRGVPLQTEPMIDAPENRSRQSSTMSDGPLIAPEGEMFANITREDGFHIRICIPTIPWIVTIENDLQLRFCDCHFHQCFVFTGGHDGHVGHINMINGHLPGCFYHRLQTDWRSLVIDSRYARMMTNNPPNWAGWLAENEDQLEHNGMLMSGGEVRVFRINMSRLVAEWLNDMNDQMFQHPIRVEYDLNDGWSIPRTINAVYDMLLDRTEAAAIEWAHTVPTEIVMHAYASASECERQTRAVRYQDARDVRALAQTYRMSILGIVHDYEGPGQASHARLNGHPRLGHGTAGLWARNPRGNWGSMAFCYQALSRRDEDETGGGALSRIVAQAMTGEGATPDHEAEAAAEAESEAAAEADRPRRPELPDGLGSEPQAQPTVGVRDPPVYLSPDGLGSEMIVDIRRGDGFHIRICILTHPWILTVNSVLQLRFCDCHFHQSFVPTSDFDGYINNVDMINGHLPGCFYQRLHDWRSLVNDPRYARMMTNDPPIWGEWLAENEGLLRRNDMLTSYGEMNAYRVNIPEVVVNWLNATNHQMFQRPIGRGWGILRNAHATYDVLLDRTEAAAIEWAHTVPIEIVIHAYESIFGSNGPSECETQAIALGHRDVTHVNALTLIYRMSILGIVADAETGYGGFRQASHARLNGHPRLGHDTAGLWVRNPHGNWSSMAVWNGVLSRRDARDGDETGGGALSRIVARVRERTEMARERATVLSTQHEPQEWPIPVVEPVANPSENRSRRSSIASDGPPTPSEDEMFVDIRREDGFRIRMYISTIPWIVTIETHLQLRFCDCHFHQYQHSQDLDGQVNHVNMINGHLPGCFYQRLHDDWRSLVSDPRYACMMTNDPPIWGEWLGENVQPMERDRVLMPCDEARGYHVNMSRFVVNWLNAVNQQMFQHPIREDERNRLRTRNYEARLAYDMLLDRTEAAAIEWAHTVPIEIVIHAYEPVYESGVNGPMASECERQAMAVGRQDVRDVHALTQIYRMSILGIFAGIETEFGIRQPSHARMNGHPRLGHGTAGLWATNPSEDWSSIASWHQALSRRDGDGTGDTILSRIVARVGTREATRGLPEAATHRPIMDMRDLFAAATQNYVPDYESEEDRQDESEPEDPDGAGREPETGWGRESIFQAYEDAAWRRMDDPPYAGERRSPRDEPERERTPTGRISPGDAGGIERPEETPPARTVDPDARGAPAPRRPEGRLSHGDPAARWGEAPAPPDLSYNGPEMPRVRPSSGATWPDLVYSTW